MCVYDDMFLWRVRSGAARKERSLAVRHTVHMQANSANESERLEMRKSLTHRHTTFMKTRVHFAPTGGVCLFSHLPFHSYIFL